MVFGWLASWVFKPVEEAPWITPKPLGNLSSLAARGNDAAAAPITTTATTTSTDRAARRRYKPFLRRSDPPPESSDTGSSSADEPRQYSYGDYAIMLNSLTTKVEGLNKEVRDLGGEVRDLEGEVGAKDDLLAELNEKNALLSAIPKRPGQKETGTQVPSPNGSKRRSPSDSPSPSKPRKRVKLTEQQIASLVKHDGKLAKDGRIINPEGVVAGIISNKFPTTLKNWESRGFRNRKNDCYRNAALQALLHVPAVYHLLGNMHRDCKKKLAECITCALQEVCHRYWDEPKSRGRQDLQLDDLHSAVLSHIPKQPATGSLAESLVEMHKRKQLDAMDYLRFVLEHLEDDSDSTLPESVEQVFGMPLKLAFKCVDCREVNETAGGPASTSLVLPLNLPNGERSVANCLRKEFVDSDVNPRCESVACEQARANADKRKKKKDPLQTQRKILTRTPEVLVMQQKRFFQEDAKLGQINRKYMEDVHCEEYLNLGPYTADGSDLFYRLDAVVGHEGKTIGGGHYITTVRALSGDPFATLNDTKVTPTKDIARFYYPDDGVDEFQPYILIYTKIGSGAKAKQRSSDKR